MEILGNDSLVRSIKLNSVAIIFLAILTYICFGKTIGGYFYADDFSFLEMANDAVNGHPEILLKHLHSSFPDGSYTQFYRPLIPLTIGLYYVFWGVNAFGYHVASLFTQFLSAMFLYLVSQRLLSGYLDKSCRLAALLTACLYLANPLHIEVIAWPSELGDGIGTALYLASIWLFLRSPCHRSSGPSLLTFALSLLYKEVAIGLPAVLVLSVYFLEPSDEHWIARLRQGVKVTTGYWIIFALYLTIRYFALGTVVGGYFGSASMGGISTIIERIFLHDGLSKVSYPITPSPNDSTFLAVHALQLAYVAIGLLVAFRSLTGLWSDRALSLMAFAVWWLLLSVLPTLPAWHISSALSGGRYMHLALAPLSLFVALAAIPLLPAPSALRTKSKRLCSIAAHILICGLIACFVSLAQRESGRWLAAGHELGRLQAQLLSTIVKQPDATKLVLLNPPDEIEGVPAFTSFSMLQSVVRPPFSNTDFSSRLASLSVLYFPRDVLNISRLKTMLLSQNYAFCVWNSSQKCLTGYRPGLASPQTCTTVELPIVAYGQVAEAGEPIERYICKIPPETNLLNYDLIEVTSAPQRPSSGQVLCDKACLAWAVKPHLFDTGIKKLELRADNSSRSSRQYLSVSDTVSWLLADRTVPISIDLPARCHQKILSVKLISGRTAAPTLRPDNWRAGYWRQSIYPLDREFGAFSFDASKVPGAARAILEISPPDMRFIDFSRTFRDHTLSAYAWKRIKLDGLQGSVKLPAAMFKSNAVYELRVAALSADDKLVGFLSDPVEIQCTGSHLSSTR